jgi:hypothetical protein
MIYAKISFNSEFIAGFERQSDWMEYVKGNKHWGLTREQFKELHKLCRLKHNKNVPLAGDSEKAGEE